jgi:hypothetical protein
MSGSRVGRKGRECPTADTRAGTPRSSARATGVALVSGWFVALAAWSWNKWPDLRVDFGDELYVPWQLVSGRVLYRDIAQVYGPLSKYLNASLFALFGPGLNRLVLFNLVVTALTAGLLARLAHRGAGKTTAVLAPVLFLGCFAFCQYGLIGNFNWICPYRHEAVHGTVLGLAALACLESYVRTGRRLFAALGGAGVGAALLTKPEMGLGAAAASAVMVLLDARARHSWRAVPAFGASVLAPPLVAAVAFALGAGMSWRRACEAALGAFVPLVHGSAAATPFFRRSFGADRLGEHLALMALGAAGTLGVVVFVAVAARWVDRSSRAREGKAALALVVLAVVGLGLRWSRAEHFLAPLVLSTAAFCCGRAWRERTASPTVILRAGFCVFALALLGKILLWPRIPQFGFVLALPAAMIFLALAADGFPEWLGRLGPERRAFARASTIVLVLACCASHVARSEAIYAHKTFAVGGGADRFWGYAPDFLDADQRIVQAMAALQTRSGPQSTLAVVPQGIMVNYLLRRENPTRFTILSTTEWAAYGEAAVVEDFQRHRPREILWVSVEPDDFGVGRFGTDPRYGQAFSAWVRQAYSAVWRVGGDPLEDGPYGVALFELSRQTTSTRAPAITASSGTVAVPSRSPQWTE